MTDSQIIAVAITVLAILMGVLVNNSRIGDVQARLGDVKDALRAETRAEIASLRVEINDRFNGIENKLDTILRLEARS